MEGFDPNNPIFLKTGDELTPEEQVKILQCAVEALSHITKAQAILDDIELKRKHRMNSLLDNPLKY